MARSLIYENTLCPTEQRRCRHCRGCKYFECVSSMGCCNYFLYTGIRRPAPFGLKDCPVRVDRKGFVQPEWHKQFCDRVDAEEEMKQKRQERKAEQIRQLGYDPDKPQPKRRGRRPTWDTEYGKILYLRGYYLFEISEILNVKKETIWTYATDNFWQDEFPQDVTRHRHDLEAAKIEYEAWLRNGRKTQAEKQKETTESEESKLE